MLNVTAMEDSAGAFLGEHDFHAFTSQHGILAEGCCVSFCGEDPIILVLRSLVSA